MPPSVRKPGETPALPGWVAALAIVIVALVAFANAWPNNLTYDDKYLADGRLFQYLSSHFVYFNTDVWSLIGIGSQLYRPVFLMSLMLDWYVWGDWHAGFHLTNLMLNALASLTVFGCLRELFRRYTGDGSTSDLYALFAALVFAVHPVHAEVVNSIFNRSGMLVTIGGAGGLWWLFHHLDRHPARAWAGFALTYLFALLSKENAAVIPGLAVALIVLFEPGSLTSRIRKFLPVFWLLLPLALYFLLRSHALATPVPSPAGDEEMVSGLSRELARAEVQSGRNIALTFGFLGKALTMMIWPYPLRIMYPPPETPALVLAIVGQLVLLITGCYRYWKGKPVLLASLAFFYIAILPASRLINLDASSPHLADRYLYFPSLGLAILLAFALRYLGRKRGRRMALTVTTLLLMVFMPLSWARNVQWHSDVSLFESEYLRGNETPTLLGILTGSQVKQRNFKRAETICDGHREQVKVNGAFAMQCALAYTTRGREDDATEAFKVATKTSWFAADAHANLGRYYLRHGDRDEADRQLKQAIQRERYPHVRALREAERLIMLYPTDRQELEQAREYLRKALRIEPEFTLAKDWLNKLNEALDQAPAGTAPSAEPDPGDGE